MDALLSTEILFFGYFLSVCLPLKILHSMGRTGWPLLSVLLWTHDKSSRWRRSSYPVLSRRGVWVARERCGTLSHSWKRIYACPQEQHITGSQGGPLMRPRPVVDHQKLTTEDRTQRRGVDGKEWSLYLPVALRVGRRRRCPDECPP